MSAGQIQEVVSLKLAAGGSGRVSRTIILPRSAGECRNGPVWRVPWRLIRKSYFLMNPRPGWTRSVAGLLDELILELRESLGATVVVVTHELASIFTIGNNSVFLDPEKKTMIAQGDPKKLLAESDRSNRAPFLTRGEG